MKRLMRRSLSVFAILMLFLSLVTVNVIATEYSGEAESVAEKDASTVAEVPQSISMDASEESRFNESINSELNKNLEIENASSIDLNHQLNVTDDEGYLWPVPKCRYISNYFGNGHEGIDIASNSPCDIVAARGGTVIAAQSNTCSHVSARCNCNYGMGNYVQIRQNDGRYSTYMHMKKGTITVSVGQAVNQGDKLGEMGSSGNSTGQHLHYQVTETSTKRVINTNPDVFGYKLEATPKDTTLPIVERVWFDNQAGDGRMLHMEVTDNVNVNRVWCPTFAPGEGEGQYFSKEASRKAGSATEWMCAIFAADHGGKQGEYQTRVYAFDDAGNVSECYVIGYYIDCEIPVIKSVTVTDVSSTGYTVNCTFSDNLGIDRVMFPTWTENNEQDDIYWKQGEVNGNTARCRIVMSDFSCQKDNYITHVYVYDKALNAAVYGLNVDLKKGNDKIFGEATYQNSRYLLMDDAVTWDEAKAKAQAKGGHLAIITSQDEQNVINGLLKKGCQIQYFIGGSRNNGNFVWSTGEALSYTNWNTGEPNNYKNNENYLSIFETGKWNDNSNTAHQGYIVEIERKLFKSYIDTPTQSSVIKDDTFIIQGWGIDENEISKFTYQINGGSENELDRCDRSDVLKANPSYSTNKPGFKEAIKSSELKAGPNVIAIHAYTNSGVKTIGTVNVAKEIVKEDTVINCSYQTHVQNVGWQDWKTNGDMSGTSGKGLRLEGIRIKTNISASDLGLSYATHVQNIGWQDPVDTGLMSGTSGKGLRLEAIRINLTGSKASQYDVYYRVHAENVGWLDWAKNGADSGTAGFGYRLEGIEIKVLPKGSAAPGNTTRPFVSQ